MKNKLNLFIILPVVLVLLVAPMFAGAELKPIENPAGDYFVSVGGDGSFKAIFEYIIKRILLPLVGTVCLLFIIIGGFRYITSGGDAEAAESGKKMVSNAVIGLIIVILSYIIVLVVVNTLRGGVS